MALSSPIVIQAPTNSPVFKNPLTMHFWYRFRPITSSISFSIYSYCYSSVFIATHISYRYSSIIFTAPDCFPLSYKEF